jgi:diamine N-acetyltransferase
MKNPFRIIPCTSNDAEKLAEISSKTFVDAFASYNTEENMQTYLAESYSIAQISKELANPDSLHFFLLDTDEAIGFMKLNFAPAQADIKDPHSLEIQRIYLKKSYWGHGLGDVLMNRALYIAKDNHLSYVWLGVWNRNERAIKFYEKQGFVPFSSHTFMLGTDEQTDILMKLELIDLQS